MSSCKMKTKKETEEAYARTKKEIQENRWIARPAV